MKVARIYQRVSTEEQDLKRQDSIIEAAKSEGYYIAGVYKEKASGARSDRPELNRLIKDLQAGEVVIAEKLDRISRLPISEAEQLISTIKATGAKLAVPGVVDLSDLVDDSQGVTRIVLEAVQDMLLKVALQSARDDYEDRRRRQKEGIALAKIEGKYTGRVANTKQHDLIIMLRKAKHSIRETAELASCSESQVKRVWSLYRDKQKQAGSVSDD